MFLHLLYLSSRVGEFSCWCPKEREREKIFPTLAHTILFIQFVVHHHASNVKSTTIAFLCNKTKEKYNARKEIDRFVLSSRLELKKQKIINHKRFSLSQILVEWRCSAFWIVLFIWSKKISLTQLFYDLSISPL